MTNLSKKEPSHFAYIDAVRGMAFLAVLAVHSASTVGHFFGKYDVTQGVYGVQLFFLASAITLCYSMSVRQKLDRFPIFNFYLRRLFRIAPCFWFAMVFYWIFPTVMPTFWLAQFAPSGVHPSYFVLTALFLHGWHPYTFNSIVPGGWSIAVEMTFYVFLPLIFYYLGHSLKRTIIAVLLSIIYIKMMGNADSLFRRQFESGIPDQIWGFFTSYWFPAQLPVFLIGFLAYHLIFHDTIKALVKNQFWAGSLLCFCAIFFISFIRGNSGFIPNNLLIVLTLAGFIIAISGGRLPWLTNPFICYIGKISYSCYLVHGAALGITLKMLGIHLTADLPFFDTGHSFSNLMLFTMIITITLILTMAISTITLHLIENPGIALGRVIIRRISDLSTIKYSLKKSNG